ncbi:MAG: hypothetical protein ACREUU_17100 [Gammaproteobacteria bacterium]
MDRSFAQALEVKILSLKPLVKYEDKQELVLKTEPGATCDGLRWLLNSSGSRLNRQPGPLEPQTAGEDGTLKFTWTVVNANAYVEVVMTCKKDGRTGTARSTYRTN